MLRTKRPKPSCWLIFKHKPINSKQIKLVKETDFTKTYFDESNELMLDEWKDDNENISYETLREVTDELADTMKSYSPIYHIADNSNRKWPFSIEIQGWIASTLAEACTSVGLKILAIILPQESIAHLSTEQAVDEVGKPSFDIKYFNDKSEAMQWIKPLDENT